MIEVKICIAAYDEKRAWAIFASHSEVIADIQATSPQTTEFMCSSSKSIVRPPSDGVWMFVGTRSRWSDRPDDETPSYAGTYRRLTDVELAALGSGENPCDPCGV